jgi:hypothetical protein
MNEDWEERGMRLGREEENGKGKGTEEEEKRRV